MLKHADLDKAFFRSHFFNNVRFKNLFAFPLNGCLTVGVWRGGGVCALLSAVLLSVCLWVNTQSTF